MRAASAIAALMIVLTIGSPVRSAASTAVSCKQDLGKKTPVLLVHGYNSSADTWKKATGDKSVSRVGHHLRDLSGTELIKFRYGGGNLATDKALSNRWVTDPGIGPLLAKTIHCLADSSRNSGGRGKVIVVAHSMGGLALRCALASDCSGDDAVTGSEVGLAITFDTPHQGSFLRGGRSVSRVEDVFGAALSGTCQVIDYDLDGVLRDTCFLVRSLGTSDAAKAFTPGSRELRDLAELPSDVPVLALAGKIGLTTSLGSLWRHTLVESIGDSVVAVTSAQDLGNYQGQAERRTIDCGVIDFSALAFLASGGAGAALASLPLTAMRGVTCSHVTETSDDRFLGAAAPRIKAWLAASPIPRPQPTQSTPEPTQPTPPPTERDSAAAETTCAEFEGLSDADQIDTVRQMIDDYGLTGPTSGNVQLTWVSTTFMCRSYPSSTPIKQIYSYNPQPR